MQWGQFIDHDITSSSQSRGFNGSVPRCCKDGGRDFVPKEFLHPECMPISVPLSDPFYGPRGVRCLDFIRSSPAPRDDCALGWREQMNQVSAYIDGSPLYGSSARQSDKLRLFRNGMLQYGRVQQRRPLLPPERRDELCRGGAVSTDCFKSGDGRVNEHPGLVAAHIVWLRQHNRMAQELAHLNPHWSDEKIYQETRKIVGAMIQHITYREFLPIVLGNDVMHLFDLELLKKGFFRGYSPKTNPSPASSFGSAAFRFGHSLVQPSMVRFDRFHRPINNNVSLHDELTNPSNIWSIGAVDRLLLGMVNQPIQKRDEHITEELTNHLFQTPQFDFGMDLAAINIQRGRDHGVAPYTSWREPCGLTRIRDFEDLFRVMPSRTVQKLQNIYRHVHDIDLFTGGMAERPVVGGLVGPTFACIIAQQFSNLRRGDRFWYENGGFDSSFTPAQLQQIRRITFAQVLCRTLDNIDNIQPFVFLSANNDNDRISCLNGLLNNFDLSPWTEIGNDISKSEGVTKEPKTEKPTTNKPVTSTKPSKKAGIVNSNKGAKRPTTSTTNTTKTNKDKDKPEPRVNETDLHTHTDLTLNNSDITSNGTVSKIDDKLDFKNKSRRYEIIERSDDNRYIYPRKPIKYNTDYDYEEIEDNVNSQQQIVINNLSHKRPSHHHHYNYQRPVISVTENIDKFTYLINYVPKPTQSWRRNTKPAPYKAPEHDIVKVTYQSYDNTYNRRPYRPYFSNRQDDRHDTTDNYRLNRPDTHQSPSSARSNDFTTAIPLTIAKKTDMTTTDNYKLVTFRYVGTYKGHDFNDKHKETIKTDMDGTKVETEKTDNVQISKDFSTYDNDNSKIDHDVTDSKLSTFFLYETATKPYNRPTRRNDDANNYKQKVKYYYINNVLHKYPIDATMTVTEGHEQVNNDFVKEKYEDPGLPQQYHETQERFSANKLALLEEIESGKSADQQPKKPSQGAAKTPSVAFQVIPSENSPTMWAFYEEKSDLPDGLPHAMPIIQSDPYALKEVPRPMDFSIMRNRRKTKRKSTNN